ncbi:unnamed protein product [Dicrocoelium dendriticum]|nr:unnamed protein product [Dicrocoelium dendriticum]
MSEGFQSASLTQFFSDKPDNCRTYDAELAIDLGSNLNFTADFHKFDNLKNLLDCNKEAFKLDAMRQIIEMVARGRDCSELFPAVVKNVVSKNPEVRKLVYIYLTRYAEEHQDIALLSVSTFQRSLKDPNPLVRGSALRVLSSIRIPMLVPIVMLALEEACKDISPYVRKLSAYAVLKVYRLDPSEKERLVKVVEQLLTDKTTLVIGNAVWAFDELCPDRFDLIHPHYRRMCSLLMDVDEWGQVVMLDMLTRYARTQFLEPKRLVTSNAPEPTPICNPVETDSTPQSSPQRLLESAYPADVCSLPDSVETYPTKDALSLLQSDMNLLLHPARLLLHSQNTAVVVAVGKLLLALESTGDYPAVAKAFVRCLHNNTETQYVILCIIASLTINHHNLFEPYQRSFYVFSDDPLDVKLIKLEILTNLATEITVPTILREFQYYASSPDPEFVIATVQAIGRCASAIPQMSDVCLNGLVRLMSRSDDRVVAECVVVLRRLLQMQVSIFSSGSCL